MRNVHLLLLSFLLYFISGSFFVLQAQDRHEVDRHLKNLCSDDFAGRGYVDGGDGKAAKYIAAQLKHYGLEPISGSYFQPFEVAVNTLPGVSVSVGNKILLPGDEFILKASATSLEGTFPCKYLPLSSADSSSDLRSVFLVGNQNYKELRTKNIYGAKGFVMLDENQPQWSVHAGLDTSSYQVIHVLQSALTDSLKSIKIQVESEFIPSYQTQNVWGLIKGTGPGDSLIIIGAHYDHLGKMGTAIYHGANDNASGTAMVLELARHYAKNPPKYSILFAFFAAEELGLIGSRYMASHFPLNLAKTKIMINLDMVGTGSDGITVVNGLQHEDIFRRLVHVNAQAGLLKEVKARGESCNSDHCPFSQLHVPSIFIYTMGNESKAYHIPQDDVAHLPLTAFDNLFKLLVLFVDTAK